MPAVLPPLCQIEGGQVTAGDMKLEACEGA